MRILCVIHAQDGSGHFSKLNPDESLSSLRFTI
jgi:hypothetical protein